MSDLIKIVNEIPKHSTGKKSDEKAIENVEKELGVKFSNSYKEYLKEFGTLSFGGTELTGITNNNYNDVTRLTKKLRLKFEDLSSEYYVIEDLASDGIYMISNKNDEIFRFHEGKIVKKYKSFADYIKSCKD